MDPASQLAHKRFPTLFSVAERETQQLDYPSANLLRCVAVDAASGFPVVVSRGHSLNAISEQASHVELLQQVDSGGQIIADHYVAAVCPPLPQPSLSNPSPKPSKAKHFSCYFPAEFLNISFIFHGKYAGAFRAVSAATGASVVIKRIDMRRLKNLRSNFSKLVAREKLLLQRLSNPRIPSMIRQYVDPLDDELVYFVLEDGGSSTVINLLRSSMMSSTVLQPSIIKQIMIDVFSALSYLHHNNIVHRDLKADNITVSSHDMGTITAGNVVAQIIDLGMGRLLIENDPDPAEIQRHDMESVLESEWMVAFDQDDPESPMSDHEPLYRRCTPSESSALCVFSLAPLSYSAPEICLTKGNYNSKVDVFAVGCILAELLFCCNSTNFHRQPGQDGEYLKRRWLFPARMLDQSQLPPFQQIVPILRHAVFDQDDVQYPRPNRAILTTAACDRLTDERFCGFDRAAMLQCQTEFDVQDLSVRFADPSNLDAQELEIFRQLRDVLKGCLMFDPSRRFSSHKALETLTGRIHHYLPMPAQALDDMKSVELAVQCCDPDSLERRRRFIKHCPPDGQSTPVSEFLDPARAP